MLINDYLEGVNWLSTSTVSNDNKNDNNKNTGIVAMNAGEGEMFASGSGSGSAPGAGAATSSIPPVVPTRFVWPHGGRRVHLCGSFTRWQDLVPMSPVEGCASVFQVVYSLPLGYHQYKFYVDGEWRHDEQQPSLVDAMGSCNNYLWIRGAEIAVPLSPAEGAGSGANMDVDQDTFSHEVHHSDLPQRERIPPDDVNRVPQSDVESLCRRFHDFLSTHTAYELLPDSGKIVTLDVMLPVKQAFHVLFEQGIPVAPLWDSERQQFVGMLTGLDFITILRQIESRGAMLSEEEIDNHTIADWKEEKLALSGLGEISSSRTPRQLVHVGPDDSLREVASRLLQYKVSTVPVLYFASPEQTSPRLLHLASLSEILKSFCRHFKSTFGSLALLSRPIGALPIGTWRGELGMHTSRHLAVLRAHDKLSDAFEILVQGVSAVPIVDNNGSLLDIYARSDITALAKDKTYACVQLDRLTVSQALQIGQEANSCRGLAGGPRCHMCLRSDSLQKIIQQLAAPGVRRLVCVEPGSRRVEGIISLTDIFQFLII